MKKEITVVELREMLARLCSTNYPADLAVNIADIIREAVGKGITTWKKLGTTNKKLKELVRQAKVADLMQGLTALRGRAYSADEAENVASNIRNAVNKGVTMWEELATTNGELEELVKQARVADLMKRLAGLRRGDYSIDAAVNIADIIQEAVGKGVMTWEELGITSEKLSELVRQAEVQ